MITMAAMQTMITAVAAGGAVPGGNELKNKSERTQAGRMLQLTSARLNLIKGPSTSV